MMLTYFFAKGIIITKSSDAQKAVYPTRREPKWEQKQRCTLPGESLSGNESSGVPYHTVGAKIARG